jgi:hypothetical protein
MLAAKGAFPDVQPVADRALVASTVAEGRRALGAAVDFGDQLNEGHVFITMMNNGAGNCGMLDLPSG